MPEGRTKYLKIGDVIGTVKVADEQQGMLVQLDVLYGGAINRASRNGPQFLKGADYAQKLQEFWDSDAGKDYVIYDTQRIIEDHQRAKAMYEAYFAKLRAEEAEKAAKLRAEETAKQEAIREEDKQRVIENMAQDRNSDAAKLLSLKKKAEEKRIAAEKAEQEASAPVKAPNAVPELEESEPNVQAEPDPAPATEAERTESQEPDAPEEANFESDEPSEDDVEAPAAPSAPQTVEAPAPQKNAPVQSERIHDTVDDHTEEDSAPDEETGKAMNSNSNEKPENPTEVHSDSYHAPMDRPVIQEQAHAEGGTQIVKLVFPKWVKVVSIIALILLFLLVAVIVAKFVLLYLPTILNGKKLVSTGDVWNAITAFPLRAGPDL